jgi:hypothetical protein
LASKDWSFADVSRHWDATEIMVTSMKKPIHISGVYRWLRQVEFTRLARARFCARTSNGTSSYFQTEVSSAVTPMSL